MYDRMAVLASFSTSGTTKDGSAGRRLAMTLLTKA